MTRQRSIVRHRRVLLPLIFILALSQAPLLFGPLAAPLGIVPQVALADDATVATCDEASFIAALNAVQSSGGGTISISCSGTIVFADGQKTITSNVVIIGDGDIVFDGDNTRLFQVNATASLTVVNLTLRNGSATNGGAINNAGTLTILAGTLTSNTATNQGGAIFNSGTAAIIAPTIDNNSAFRGGGIFNTGSLTVTASTLSGNTATELGGGIANDTGGTATVTDTTIDSNNSAQSSGIANFGTIDIIASTLSGNTTTERDGVDELGAGFTNNGTANVTNSTFSGNTTGRSGSAIFNDNDGILTLTASTISGNTAVDLGGGIVNDDGGRVTIIATTIDSNSAFQGGGIFNGLGGILTLTASTVSGNRATATGGGGGGFANKGTANVANSTFSGNTTGGQAQGSAILNDRSGTLSLTASTISGNSGPGEIAAAIRNIGFITAKSTIVAGNSAPNRPNCAIAPDGTLTSQGYNLSDNSDCGFTATGDIQNSGNVNLGALADNGGPTETMLPQAGSDATEAIPPADCATLSSPTGQRGVVRPQDTNCEIGAVELGSVPVQILTIGSLGGGEGSPVRIYAVVSGPAGAILDDRFDCDGIVGYETPGTSSGSTSSAFCTFDDDGNFTVGVKVCHVGDGSNCDSDTTIVTITNIAPTIDAGGNQSANEGDTISLDPASFIDPGTADVHTATINWGDGSPDEAGTVTETNGSGTVGGSHVYVANGVYTVEVCVEDDEQGVDCDTFEATVNNVAPTVDAGGDQSANEGDTISLDPASFIDPGVADVHTATINWGDGSPDEAGTVTEANGSGTVSGSHVYAGNGVYTVEVCVEDEQDVGCDDLEVTAGNLAPTVEVPVGEPNPANEGESVTASADINDRSLAGELTCEIDWGDGTSPTAGTVSISVCSSSHVYADDNPTGTSSDTYTVTFTVTDDDNASHQNSYVQTVNNVAPVVAAPVVVPSPSNEGDEVAASAAITDPGVSDTYTCEIDWGDGTLPATGTVSNLTCSGKHTYVDDNPSNTLSDDYTITFTVTDDDGGSNQGSVVHTVNNVAPAVVSPNVAPGPTDEAEEVTASAEIADAGAMDTHTCEIDWGDETNPTTGTVSNGTCSGNHTYADDNPSGTSSDQYTVTFTVTDDDGGSNQGSVLHTVENVAPSIEQITVPAVADLASQVSVSVDASDPAGAGDPLTYAFDCDGDGSYERDAGSSNSTTCRPDQTTLSPTIGVQVTDDDLGVTTGAVELSVEKSYCANSYTGSLRDSTSCVATELAVVLRPDQVTHFCANQFTGALLHGGASCNANWTSLPVPAAQPISICENRYTGRLTYVNGRECTSMNIARIIPAR